MIPIVMPQIGQDIETGVITRWTKKVGDPVVKGEVVAAVEGDKATFDIEAQGPGILLSILVGEGVEGRVLEAIGYIGSPGELAEPAKPGTADPAASVPESSGTGVQPSRIAVAPPPGTAASGRTFSSPAARRVARERGLPLASIKGSGPGGRIMKRDVVAAPTSAHSPTRAMDSLPSASPVSISRLGDQAPEARAQPSSQEGGDTVVPFTRMRQVIADRLSLSKSTIPHFYLFQDIDVEDALAWRELFNARNASKVTVTDMVVWAAAATLREVPKINAHVGKDRLVMVKRISVGIATASEDGLLVPVVRDADGKDLQSLSAEIKQLADEARRGKIDPNVKGSFTVTSLGMFGTQSFLPIINPPEAAILAVGAAEPRPVAVGNLVGVHRVMTVTLACDHRAVNGAEAARFLSRFREVFTERFQPAR